MTGLRALGLTILLAAIAIGGIVGMLLAEGILDWAFFAMAATPLAAGLGCWRRAKRQAKPTAASR